MTCFTFFFELQAADGCVAVVAKIDVVGGWIWQLTWLCQLVWAQWCPNDKHSSNSSLFDCLIALDDVEFFQRKTL
jgi:hypothetical protein